MTVEAYEDAAAKLVHTLWEHPPVDDVDDTARTACTRQLLHLLVGWDLEGKPGQGIIGQVVGELRRDRFFKAEVEDVNSRAMAEFRE